MTPLDVQFITIISMIGGGFYLGLALETFRRFSPYWRRPVWLLFIMEVSFWLMQTAFLFYILFRANQGELRVYIFAAILLGFAAYQALFRSLYKRLLERVITIGAMVIRTLKRLIEVLLVAPVKGLISILLAAVLFIVQLAASIIGLAFKIVWFPLGWILRLIWRLLPKNVTNFLNKFAGLYSTIKGRCSKIAEWIKSKRR